MSHKATSKEWAHHERFIDFPIHSALLELRDRLAALEAAHQQPEPIDEEENDRRFRACLAAIDNATPEQIKAAVAKASANHFVEAPKMVPDPADGLVERVAEAIWTDPSRVSGWDREARAAILAVVEWLDGKQDGQSQAARWLREEVQGD